MDKSMQQDFEFGRRSVSYLLKRLEPVEKRLQAAVEKEKADRAAQIEKMSEYKTLDEAADAYGYGSITQQEYEEIMDKLEMGTDYVENTRTPRSAALKTLQEFMRELHKELDEYEWELKTPEEKARIMQQADELRERRRKR